MARMTWIIGGLAGLYMAAAGYLTAQQEHYIFPQRVNTVVVNAAQQQAYTTLEMADETVLSGVVYPAPNGATLVVAFGGNAHDATGFAHFLHKVYGAGVGVVAFSYRGYPNAVSHSEGEPTQEALYADALAIYDSMVARLKPAKVVVVGYSLGGAVASYVATQRPVAALGLVAPFESMTAMAQGQYPIFPVSLLLRHPFPTAQQVRAAAVPVHLLLADHDGLIAPEQSEAVRQAAGGYLLQDMTVPATHGTVLDQPGAVDFLRKVLP